MSKEIIKKETKTKIVVSNQKKVDLLASLEKHLGVITKACREVGISREAYKNLYESDIEFREKADLVTEVALDFAEDQLLQLVKEKNEKAILFYLKCKGKKRGYSESPFDGGDKIQINVLFNNE